MLGAIFVAIVVFMPEGLVPGTVRLARAAWRAQNGRGRSPPAMAATAKTPIAGQKS